MKIELIVGYRIMELSSIGSATASDSMAVIRKAAH
jgi:hypothetical protein